NGEYSISLLVAHAVLTIWGYGITAHENVLRETRSVVFTYPDMLAATVGLGLLVAIGVLSARTVRRKVNYQTWYFLHLYTYLALALSFAHQFSTGLDFAHHPLNRAAWIALYAGVGLLLVGYRVVKPLRDFARYDLRVSRVVPEGPRVVSFYLTGRHLSELEAESGQFFMWRFLTRDHWWQAHPFSLSAAPNGRFLRLTVKALGDHSRDLSRLLPGTRVIGEGPYGAFTARRRGPRKVVLIAGGIGVTPLRALYESLPGVGGDVTLIYRVDRPDDLVFRSELEAIARARRGKLHYLVGLPRDHPEYLSAVNLRSLVPDIARRDVFLCGPPAMQAIVIDSLIALRVPRRQIHQENFEL
ncbi:MAG: ferredoxin reductase family protein, partial [Acidimicrobiaceae bacterium]|nr:ferredoxin reductase family protein [Acidimicrobiaceae bacterium]